MKRSIQGILYFLSLVVLLAGCNKDELDAYYGRPSNLAPPIYQQLKDREKFSSMTAVIEKAGYTDILGKGGYWTLFAPNNEAFKAFFQERGLSDISQIDKETAVKIVRYATLYNTYRKDNIDMYESPQKVLVPFASFRKKSTYYEFVYEKDGKKYIDANMNSGYVLGDNNNKYLQIFTTGYFNFKGLTSQDYTTFFPGSTFMGFNVLGAQVKEFDILAENGIIHEVDKVLTPLQNLDQYLGSKPEYSEFRKLLESYLFYAPHYTLQTRYKALSGSDDSVFVKAYIGTPFAPNNENLSLTASSDAQSDFWSLAIPTNDKLLAYKTELLKDWGPELSPAMLRYLVSSHMWETGLWPSKLTTTVNSLGEKATFGQSAVLEKKMLSNGNFYGISQVQEANAFRTVYAKPFLNKDYLMQTRGLDRGIVSQLLNPDNKFGLIMQSDQQFLDIGYSFDPLVVEYSWRNPANGSKITNAVARDRFLRNLGTTVFDNSLPNLTDLSGEGILKGNKGAGETEEYLYYKNNKIYASGNINYANLAASTPVQVTKVVQTANGPVFYTTGSLNFTEKKIGTIIKELATLYPSSYKHFYDYLRQSTAVWDNEAIKQMTLGLKYTALIPTNAAIEAAVKRGELPGTVSTGAPTTNPTTALAKTTVEQFLLSHFIDKETVAPDGDDLKTGRMKTLFEDFSQAETGTFIFIDENKPGFLKIRDAKGNIAATILVNSNKLADRALIHSIDRVLWVK